MNHMLEALKKKVHAAKGDKPDLEIKIGEHSPTSNDDHDERDDEIAGPAPHMDHELEHDGDAIHEDALHNNKEEDEEMKDAEDTKQHLAAAESNMDHLKGLHGAPMDEGSEDHLAILKGLSDHGVQGRGAMKLSERVASNAKEKMASIMKHKKERGY